MKAPIATLALSLLVPACTAKNAGYERQLARLNENVLILQHERDRLEERIAVLESERVAPRQSEPAEGTLERPPLKVVQLEPPGEAAVAAASALPEPAPTGDPNAGEVALDAAEGAARVLIHGTGTELRNSPLEGGPNEP